MTIETENARTSLSEAAAHRRHQRSTRCAPRRPRSTRSRTPRPRAAAALRCAAQATACCCVVLGNPCELDTQDWIEERLREPFGYRIAQRADVAGLPVAAGDRAARPRRRLARSAAGVEMPHGCPGDLVRERRRGRRHRWCAWSPRRCTTRSRPARATCTWRRPAAGLTIKYRIDGVLTSAREHRRHRARRAGDLAHQGDVGARHRRAARAAGRALQGAPAADGPRHRLPRVGHAERVRRGRGAADPRPPGALRPAQRPDPGLARLRRGPQDRGCAGCRPSPTACCWSPARPAAARPPRCTP